MQAVVSEKKDCPKILSCEEGEVKVISIWKFDEEDRTKVGTSHW